FDLDEYVHSALRAGACGFLLKNSPPDQLAHAIRVVARGEAMLAPSVTHRLINAFTALPVGLVSGTSKPASGRHELIDSLTERELEVLILVARGLPTLQTADEPGRTQANVKGRLTRLLTRLGLDNRVQAAILAREASLLAGPAQEET